ncbi:3-galactosyl-N-acetylglucosaminide 4-alpha-L-fucosyltransferase FUT3-like [Clavelina lepadiformis]|uniref:3-galactosyl-N-acetylglucosaminide 4-alpha-L-fucosyltransferase FUT3-like n=1 Tax=Clavelina lepadiformis TaxID=159417 RepID=UPI004042A45E
MAWSHAMRIMTFAFAVYVMFVSLFCFSQNLTPNIIAPKKFYPQLKLFPFLIKQSKISQQASGLNGIQTTHQIFIENATSSNFIKSKISDQTNDDKVVEESRLKAALEKATKRYDIIAWDAPFGSKRIPNNIITSKCGNCQFSYDRSKINDPSTKAVIFHFNEARISRMPKQRRTDQYYIWFSWESPVAVGKFRGFTLKEFDDVFNLTMTYRRDSDVYFPYQTIEKISQRIHSQSSENLQHDLDELIKSKRKVALWIVQNCGSTPGARARMKYSEQLVKAGLDLDRRGGCFPNAPKVLPKNKRTTPSWDNFLRPYKFYMAFENAFSCNDYITEKFFQNSLTHGLVPVVLGAKKSDYEAVSLNHSFIYADDFENAEKLVEYLRYLDGNDTAYREYLAWRTHDPEEMPYHGRAVGLCQLCRILHGINIDNKYDENFKEKYPEIPLYGHPKKPRIVHSLRNWFYGNEEKKCISNY